jgi:XisI protein
MASLNEIVKEVVYSYTWKGLDLKTFRGTHAEENAFSVMVVDYPVHQQDAGIVVMAHIEGDLVVIDADNTDRPLVDKLVEAGIPREKIILAYVGDKIPVAEA